MRALLLGLVVCVACGPRVTPQPIPRTGSGSSEILAPKPNVNGPSERDCDELFTHALAIVIADKQATTADAEVTAHDIRPAFIADCRAGTREYQQCGLSAKTQIELDGCRR